MSTVRLDPQALARLLSSQDGPVWADIQRRGNRVLNEAVRRCPVDEGRLKNSLTMEMRRVSGVPVAVVGTNLEYGLYVHEGTGIYGTKNPRPIRPVRARVLRWPVKNNSGSGRRRYRGGKTARYAYAKQVKGMPGRPFLRDSLPAATR